MLSCHLELLSNQKTAFHPPSCIFDQSETTLSPPRHRTLTSSLLKRKKQASFLCRRVKITQHVMEKIYSCKKSQFLFFTFPPLSHMSLWYVNFREFLICIVVCEIRVRHFFTWNKLFVLRTHLRDISRHTLQVWRLRFSVNEYGSWQTVWILSSSQSIQQSRMLWLIVQNVWDKLTLKLQKKIVLLIGPSFRCNVTLP